MSEFVERCTVNAGGVNTAYVCAGDDAARNVVLLHDGAYGSTAESCWSELIPELADSFRVVAPDLVGFGGTRKIVAFDRDPMQQRIEHIREFVRAIGCDRPLYVGSSFGGGMILRGAADGSLPMAAGVSIAGTGGLYMVLEQFSVLQEYAPTLEWASAVSRALRGDEATEEEVLGRLERSKAPGHYEALSAVRMVRPVVERPALDWKTAYVDGLSRTTTPLLLVEGSEDPLFEKGWSRQLASKMTHAESVVIDGGWHLAHAHNPKAVARVITDFFDRVSSPAP